MDQNNIRKTTIFTGIIYLLLAIVFIPASITLLLTAKGLILAGALMALLTGIACLIAFFRNISFRKEITQIEQLHIQDEDAETGTKVSWQLNSAAWNRFLIKEAKRRRSGLLLESALVIILGSVILMFSRPVGFYMSLLFTVPLALVYYLIKYRTLFAKLPEKTLSLPLL